MIGKIIEAFLFPSGLSLILIFGGLFTKRKEKYFLILTGAFLYWFFSLSVVSYSLLSSLEKKILIPENIQASTVVLLRGGAKEDVLRTMAVINLISQEPKVIKKIIVLGRNPFLPFDKGGEKIKKMLEKSGVKQKVIVESDSRNTYENAVAAKVLVGDQPFILVTSSYHLPRSLMIFQKEGMDPIPYSVNFGEWHCCSALDLLPLPSNLSVSYRALHEYLGILYYTLMYSNG